MSVGLIIYPLTSLAPPSPTFPVLNGFTALLTSAAVKVFPLPLQGDFRMVIGEDKAKVANIVKDNYQHFRTLYNNILLECPQVVYKPQQGKLEVRTFCEMVCVCICKCLWVVDVMCIWAQCKALETKITSA